MIVINKVIIKKSDATASIIFFLFSSFLLPKSIRRISLKKIFLLMKSFEKNEASIRMGLSRAVKAGILKNVRENNKVYYEITETGLKNIEDTRNIFHLYSRKISFKNNGWNNYWCTINIQSDCSNEKREEFSEYISKLGFAQINRGSFIYPFDLSKDVQLKIEELKIEDSVYVFLSRFSYYQNASKIINKLWNISEINKGYFEFITKYPPTITLTSIGESNLIPFCHSFTYDFNEIIKIDPVLPQEFLGTNWEGDKALRMVDYFNKTLVGPTKEYVNKILSIND